MRLASLGAFLYFSCACPAWAGRGHGGVGDGQLVLLLLGIGFVFILFKFIGERLFQCSSTEEQIFGGFFASFVFITALVLIIKYELLIFVALCACAYFALRLPGTIRRRRGRVNVGVVGSPQVLPSHAPAQSKTNPTIYKTNIAAPEGATENPSPDPIATIREVSTFSTFNEWAIDPETRELYSELSGESLDLGREDGYTIVGQFYLLHNEPITRKLHKSKVDEKIRKPASPAAIPHERIFEEYFRLKKPIPLRSDSVVPNGMVFSVEAIRRMRGVGTFEYLKEWFIDPYTLELYNDHTDESLSFGAPAGYTTVGNSFILTNQPTPRRLSFSKVGRRPRVVKSVQLNLIRNTKDV